MKSYTELPIGDEAPEIVNAVIEIPRGSRNKISYDAENNIFKLSKVLYSAVHYPYSYGFIPSTQGQDDDPVDVLVLCDEELCTGLLLEVIPIGGLEMKSKKGRELKVIAVAAGDESVNQLTDYKELAKHRRDEIKNFFETYKLLEGDKVKVEEWFGAKEVKRRIKSAQKK